MMVPAEEAAGPEATWIAQATARETEMTTGAQMISGETTTGIERISVEISTDRFGPSRRLRWLFPPANWDALLEIGLYFFSLMCPNEQCTYRGAPIIAVEMERRFQISWGARA